MNSGYDKVITKKWRKNIMFRKNTLAMVVGEFLGTGILSLAVLGLSHSNVGQMPWFIAVSAGLALSILVVMLANITGAVFNPALSIGLWTVRKLQSLQTVAYVLAQFAGAAAAWLLFCYFTDISIDKIQNKGFTDVNARIMVAELVGTMIFAMAVASAVYQRVSLGVKAFVVGAGLTVGALVATLGSGGILNPAVALAVHQFGLWTYVAGSVIGAILGFNLYNLLFTETELNTSRPARVADVKVAKASAPARKAASKKPAARKKTVAKKK